MLIWLTPPSSEPLQSAYRRQPIQDVASALPKAGWDNLCLVYFQANSLEGNSARQCENLPVDLLLWSCLNPTSNREQWSCPFRKQFCEKQENKAKD